MMSSADDASPHQIEVILFDAAGTLFRTARPVWEVYAAVGLEFQWRLEPERIKSAFRGAWAAMPEPEWESAGVDSEKAWWRALVRRVLAEAGVEEPGRSFDPYFDELWTYSAGASAWVLFEEVVEVLRFLRGRYRLGVLSNFDERLIPVLRGLGVLDLFEAVTISSQARARKPSLAIFTHALQSHRVEAHQVLHVGDDPEADWAGARNAGLRWFELRRPENTLRSVVNSPYLC